MLHFLCVDGPELDNGVEMMGMKRGKKKKDCRGYKEKSKWEKAAPDMLLSTQNPLWMKKEHVGKEQRER